MYIFVAFIFILYIFVCFILFYFILDLLFFLGIFLSFNMAWVPPSIKKGFFCPFCGLLRNSTCLLIKPDDFMSAGCAEMQ